MRFAYGKRGRRSGSVRRERGDAIFPGHGEAGAVAVFCKIEEISVSRVCLEKRQLRLCERAGNDCEIPLFALSLIGPALCRRKRVTFGKEALIFLRFLFAGQGLSVLIDGERQEKRGPFAGVVRARLSYSAFKKGLDAPEMCIGGRERWIWI